MKIKIEGIEKEAKDTLVYRVGKDERLDELVGYIVSIQKMGRDVWESNQEEMSGGIALAAAANIIGSKVWKLLQKELYTKGFIDSEKVHLTIKDQIEIHFDINE